MSFPKVRITAKVRWSKPERIEAGTLMSMLAPELAIGHNPCTSPDPIDGTQEQVVLEILGIRRAPPGTEFTLESYDEVQADRTLGHGVIL
jgi:hypothetical protein